MSEPNEHPQEKREEHHTVPSRSNLPDEIGHKDARVEDYLDQMFAPLIGRAPYEVRVELRREMRLHLDALIAAGQEVGLGSEEAVDHALTRFGDPRAIGRDWLREWQRNMPGRSSRAATLIALGCFALMMAVISPSMSLLYLLLRDNLHLYSACAQLLGEFMFPMLAGLATGLLSPARAVRGSMNASAVLGVFGLAVMSIMTHRPPPPSECVIHTLLVGQWMLTSCAAAALGSNLRSRLVTPLKRRRLPA